jgi:hypothetical protein
MMAEHHEPDLAHGVPFSLLFLSVILIPTTGYLIGKRSNFPSRDRDAYPTPGSAVLPLVPWLTGIRTFAEPCAGAPCSDWKAWAERAGEFVGTMRRFNQNLEARGVTPVRKMTGRGFAGLKLIRESELSWTA